MSGQIDERLRELGVELPEAAAPAANYVSYVVSGNMLYVSGQLPKRENQDLRTGTLGTGVAIEVAQAEARQCGINIIAQVKKALDGNLDRVKRCIKLGGFVACSSDFFDHPKVINGASDLMVEVFKEKGKHARFAVGAESLPFGVMVEIDAIFEIE